MSKFNGIASIAEYPLGDLEAELGSAVMAELSQYNFHEMSCRDLHMALLDIRQKCNIPPWHYLTAVVQAYGNAVLRTELMGPERRLTKDQSWCSDTGGGRPIRNLEREYEDVHDVFITEVKDENDTTRYAVGKLVLKLDGMPCIRFWSYQTERLLDVITGGSLMRDPRSGIVGRSLSVLRLWKKYLQPDGSICVDIGKHKRLKVPKKILKQSEETPELPFKFEEPKLNGNPIVAATRHKRLYIVTIIQSILHPALFSLYALGKETEKAATARLISALEEPLKNYAVTLTTNRPVAERLPDNLIFACQSILELGSLKNTGVTAAMSFWFDELLKTDLTRLGPNP